MRIIFLAMGLMLLGGCDTGSDPDQAPVQLPAPRVDFSKVLQVKHSDTLKEASVNRIVVEIKNIGDRRIAHALIRIADAAGKEIPGVGPVEVARVLMPGKTRRAVFTVEAESGGDMFREYRFVVATLTFAR